MRKVHNSTFNIQNSKFIMGIALGTQIQNTMRPVWAALNKTLIYNNAVNPLKNRGYAVLVVYVIIKYIFMDPITLITTTMAVLTPYLVKSGEKIAEEMGASLWTWLKDKFSNNKQLPTAPSESDKSIIQLQLMSDIAQNK